MSYDPPTPTPAASGDPGGLSGETRGWAVVAHLSAILSAIVTVATLAFLGPLLVYLFGRDRHPFIAHHAGEALNFTLTVLLVIVVGGIVGFLGAVVTLGLGLIVIIPVAIVVALWWLVLIVIASVRAWDGEGYRYPLTIRFVR